MNTEDNSCVTDQIADPQHIHLVGPSLLTLNPSKKKTHLSSLGTSRKRISNPPLKSRPSFLLPPPKASPSSNKAVKTIISTPSSAKHSITPEPWFRYSRPTLTDLSFTSELKQPPIRYNQGMENTGLLYGKPVTKEYLNELLQYWDKRSQKFKEERRALEEKIRAKTAMRNNFECDPNKWNPQEITKFHSSLRRQSCDQADSSFSLSVKEITEKNLNCVNISKLEETKELLNSLNQTEITENIANVVNTDNSIVATETNKHTTEKESEVKEETKSKTTEETKEKVNVRIKRKTEHSRGTIFFNYCAFILVLFVIKT